MRIWTLGRFRVERDGAPITEWRRQSAASVLKRLLVAEQHRLGREYLAQQLFPTARPKAARDMLTAAVHALRVALEPSRHCAGSSRYLVQEGETLELRLESTDWVDLTAFEQALREIADSPRSLAQLEDAAALYGGDLLPEETAEWCLAPRQALQLRRHGLLLSLAEAQILNGGFEPALATLSHLLRLDPTHEEAGRRLIALLDRRGRRSEALRVYQSLKRALRRELHTGPASETEALAAGLRIGRSIARRRSSDPVHTGTPAPSPPKPVAPLIGRAEQVTRLRTTLSAVREGHGRTLLLRGEAGIGKTRLAEEAATIAVAHGFTVLWGRAGEGEQHLPYVPIIEALRVYTRSRPPRALRTELQDAQALVSLLPELAGGSQGLAAPPPLAERPAERFRLWTAVMALLAAAAESRPLLLILDDLHWADEATLGLLSFLVRRCGESRLLLLGTLREDLPDNHPLSSLVLEGTRAGSLELMPISGLLLDESASLVEQHLGSPLPEDQISALHTQCNGNPFFIGELTALLRERFDGRPETTLASLLSGEGTLPNTIRQTLTKRLDRLSNPCRALLRAGAVIGSRFSEKLLAAVVDQDLSAVEDTLDEAVSMGLVREGAVAEGGGYVLVHALICRALYEELMPGQRRRLHGRIAAILAGEADEGRESKLDLVAYHYARTHEHVPAAQWLERAGDHAASFFAYGTAIRHYAHARDHVSAEDRSGLTDADKRSTLTRLAEKIGDLRLLEGQFVAAQQDFAHARTMETAPKRLAELWRKEGMSLQRRGEYEQALSAFDGALRLSRGPAGEPLLPIPLLVTLEVSRGDIYFRQGEFGTAECAARRGLSMLDTEPEGLAAAQVSSLLGNVAAARGDLSGAEEFHQRSLAVYTRHGMTEERYLAACWSDLARVSYRKGDLTCAEDRLRHAMAVLERLGDHHGMAACANQLGLVARRQGALAEAATFHRRSLEIRERIGDQHGVAGCWNNLGLVNLDLGNHVQAEECFRHSLPLQERIGDQMSVAYVWNNLGHVAFRQADYRQAEDKYRHALALYERLGDEQAIAYCTLDLGAVALYLGNLDQAGQLHDAALEVFTRIGDQEGLAITWRSLGTLRTELGEIDAAVALCRRAGRIARHQAIPAEEAGAALCEAEAHLRRPCPDPRRLRLCAALVHRARRLIQIHGWALPMQHVGLLSAQLHLRRQETDTARSALAEVLHMAEAGHTRREESLVHRLYGECALQAGDRAGAVLELQTAMTLQEELGLVLETARTHAILSETLAVSH